MLKVKKIKHNATERIGLYKSKGKYTRNHRTDLERAYTYSYYQILTKLYLGAAIKLEHREIFRFKPPGSSMPI